jgi:hypothetical protein
LPGHGEKGTKSGKPIAVGRGSNHERSGIRTALASGKGVLKTARECGTGSSVVQRIKVEMARANGDDARARTRRFFPLF